MTSIASKTIRAIGNREQTRELWVDRELREMQIGAA